MTKLNEEMAKFVVKMDDLGKLATTLEDETNAQVADAQSTLGAEATEMEAKQKELEEKQAELKELKAKENPTEEDQEKMATLSDEVDALKSEIKAGTSEIKNMEAKAQKQIQQTAITKAQVLGKSMEDVKNQAESSLNSAVNANEYADVTIEKGMEAASITDKGEAKEAGYTKRILFWKKGNVHAANNHGNVAIAKGEILGNSTKEVGKTIKQVGTQFGMNFSKTSSIETLTNKDYVDTTKLEEAEKALAENNEGGIKGILSKAKASGTVFGETMNVAEEAKKKKAEEGQTKTENA